MLFFFPVLIKKDLLKVWLILVYATIQPSLIVLGKQSTDYK